MHAPTMCQYIVASSILNFPAFTYGLGDTAGRQISYFISPHAQNMVRAAVFYIVDDEDNGVGVGVFFSRSTAVTADHNLTVDQMLGTKVLVKIPGNDLHVFEFCKDASSLLVKLWSMLQLERRHRLVTTVALLQSYKNR